MSRRNAARQSALFRRENVTQAVQKQFEQTGTIDALLLRRSLQQVGCAPTFDRSMHLGGIKMQLLGETQVRRPLWFDGEPEQYENVLRLQHRLSIALGYSIFQIHEYRMDFPEFARAGWNRSKLRKYR
jgi:hypothetical protein